MSFKGVGGLCPYHSGDNSIGRVRFDFDVCKVRIPAAWRNMAAAAGYTDTLLVMCDYYLGKEVYS
jgi:hypothetical protein